jgi:four helix bundle protein
MYTYSFEKLDVWQLSRELVKKIYHLTRKFPDEERYGLISQIRRATISVSSNLAEGSARKTAKDQAHFTTVSYGSLMEMLNQLIISSDLKYITDVELSEIRPDIEEIGNKLNALRNSQLNRVS